MTLVSIRKLLNPRVLPVGSWSLTYHENSSVFLLIKLFFLKEKFGHDVSFEKTHDLTELLDLSAKAELTLDRWREVAQELTPYAVRFRYPSDVLEPERNEAERALQHAQAFMDFILRLLPEEVRP